VAGGVTGGVTDRVGGRVALRGQLFQGAAQQVVIGGVRKGQALKVLVDYG
jgi:hypothetical protein